MTTDEDDLCFFFTSGTVVYTETSEHCGRRSLSVSSISSKLNLILPVVSLELVIRPVKDITFGI